MDKETLYNAEVQLLRKYCHNCLDNKTKDKLVMFLFKMMLLENAEELGLSEDAKKYEIEILSLLNLTPNCCNTCGTAAVNKINCNTCCENGYCAICK